MWIKVCGIRDCQTALNLAELDVNAIGLNFYPKSPRVIDINEAVEIARVLPKSVERVGVFVNQTIDEVESTANLCQLNIVQLHGDETVSFLAELTQRLPETRLIRAWRMGATGLSGLRVFLEQYKNLNCQLAGCLIDAHVAGLYGGSGKTVEWDQLISEYAWNDWPPLILAGGLTPINIADAISSVHPWGVDVASGVESSPGIKDLDLVRKFVTQARGRSKD